jgi:hypothetical protein
MIKRLVFLVCGSAVVAAVTFLICQLAFSDVLAYATDENAQQAWRRQAAFLVITIAWLSDEVSAVSTVALAAVLWKGWRTNMR